MKSVTLLLNGSPNKATSSKQYTKSARGYESKNISDNIHTGCT